MHITILPTILGKNISQYGLTANDQIGFHMMRIEVHHFERCTLLVKTPSEEVLMVPGRGPTSPDLHKVHWESRGQSQRLAMFLSKSKLNMIWRDSLMIVIRNRTY